MRAGQLGTPLAAPCSIAISPPDVAAHVETGITLTAGTDQWQDEPKAQGIKIAQQTAIAIKAAADIDQAAREQAMEKQMAGGSYKIPTPQTF